MVVDAAKKRATPPSPYFTCPLVLFLFYLSPCAVPRSVEFSSFCFMGRGFLLDPPPMENVFNI